MAVVEYRSSDVISHELVRLGQWYIVFFCNAIAQLWLLDIFKWIGLHYMAIVARQAAVLVL